VSSSSRLWATSTDRILKRTNRDRSENGHGAMLKKTVVAVAMVAAAAAAFVLLNSGPVQWRTLVHSAIEGPADLDDMHLDLPNLDPTTWVRRFQPERASSG